MSGEPLRAHWTTDYYGIANSFGFSIHNDETREGLKRAGVVLDPEAPVAVAVAPPIRYEPTPWKWNIVYTAWENEHIPAIFWRKLQGADHIVVSASYLVGPFQRAFPRKVVTCVPEGVRGDRFTYVDRTQADRRPFAGNRPFRFLWVGAPNGRKGPFRVFTAWQAWTEGPFKRFANKVELYIKTTVPNPKGLERVGNAIIDDRRLSFDELVKLYHRAHAFVFPTHGEGFGLTAAEAAATGLPVLYPPATAMLDLFCPDSGYPLETKPEKQDWGYAIGEVGPQAEPCNVTVAAPTPEGVARQMWAVFNDPMEGFRRGRVASERMRRVFTWDNTAQGIIEAIRIGYEKLGLPVP